ncbi:MAG TPA: flagellar biosynthesis protein FlhB [Gammaproteobacteria bacterium]|nr:flagellar biosynthesis protein FlhB [Gammaproteobacteria bacterium]
MAEEEQGQEKTELPTEKRLNDARDKGQVPRSREFTTVIVLIASAVALLFIGNNMAESVAQSMQYAFNLTKKELFDTAAITQHLMHTLEIVAFDIGSFLAVTIIAAIVAPASIGGWNFSLQAMAPKGSKLSPLKGFKRMFGVQAAIELLKALGKFFLVGVISFIVLWQVRDQLLTLGLQETQVALSILAELVIWIFLIISSSLLLIAAIDVPFQHWNHIRQLKMTKQEVKDESKETEGNPEVKGRIKRLQIELSQQRMMQEVPNADVIITNPTHYAVALKYNQSGEAAPYVVAKGVDLMAQHIRQLGIQHDIAILAAPPLTRAIYFSTELGEEIPSGLYIAVAQVLAFVFQLRRYRQRGGKKPQLNTEVLPIPEEYIRD